MYEPSEFERNVKAIDAADHRGVIQGKDHGFTGNIGLVIGAGGGSLTLTDAVRSQGGKPANYAEIGGNPSVAKSCGLAKEVLQKDGVEKIAVMMSIVSNTRVDIVARGRHQGLPRARQGPGRDDRDLPHPRRLGGRGLQDPRQVRRRVLRPLRLDVGGRRPGRREGPGGAGADAILLNEDFTFIVQGITGREAVNLTRECLDFGSKIVGGVTPGRKGREVHGVPVFDTVEQAVEHHGAPIDGAVVDRPPRLHQGRRVRGDRERDQADRRRHRADPAPRRRRDGRARQRARRPDHRPQLPRPDRPGRRQDGRHRRPGEGRGQGLRRPARSA